MKLRFRSHEANLLGWGEKKGLGRMFELKKNSFYLPRDLKKKVK